jgi:hypothetical protein
MLKYLIKKKSGIVDHNPDFFEILKCFNAEM